jgi:opacity protein-like surface antigen
LNAGGNLGTDRVYSGGAVAGWNALPFLAVEGTYDYSRPNPRIDGKRDEKSTVAVNVLPQYRISSTPFKVYGLGGVGYSWNSVTADHTIYNVGGGVKYDFNKSFEVDGRYRHVDSIETKFRGDAEDRVTIGVNYKF